MQTFLPLADMQRSVQCLDSRRLGKQRVEALQILRALRSPGSGWSRHPATIMWQGREEALALYMRLCIEEWIARGYRNTMALPATLLSPTMPRWMGDESVHASHRSNLLRKYPVHYGRFG